MCGREHWIKSIEAAINPSWEPDFSPTPIIFTEKDTYSWESENPVVTFKTREGLTFKTGCFGRAVKALPYWGTVKEVEAKYL